MPRQLTRKNTPLARYLRKHTITIAEFAEDCGLSYRTVWLASMGFRVGYESARIIHSSTKKEISVESLCEGN